MQAYANVGTAPERRVAKSGKVYWEFRASESSRGEDKNPTWYTCRVFKDEDPKLAKGDFVCFTGKLKLDVFMGRDGKPMGVLTVMAFALQKIAKDGKREVVVNEPLAASSAVHAVANSPGGGAKQPASSTPPASSAETLHPRSAAAAAQQVNERFEALALPEIDESYLRLVS